MTTTQGIKLDENTRKRLKTLGAARNRSSHWLMRAAIADYLDREENAEREKREDMKRWKCYQLTGKAVPHAAVAKWLNSLARGKAKKVPAVKWLAEALADVERLLTFLHDKDPKVAARVAGAILKGAEMLKSMPRLGRPMGDDTGRREWFIPFGAGAYILRYMLEDNDTPVIIRVWHCRENWLQS